MSNTENKNKKQKLPIITEEVEFAFLRETYAQNEYDEFIDLLCNALDISNLPDNVPKDIVIKNLYEHGIIGVYKGFWLKADGAGDVNEYGIPKSWLLTSANGRTFHITTKEADAIIRLRPSARPLRPWLYTECDDLAYIKMAIKANLIACQNTEVYECGNDKTVTEMKSVFKKKTLGMPVIFSRKDGLQDNINNLSNKNDLIADRLFELYTEQKNRVKERLGILTANSNKRERVQVGEITASVGEVIDSIYTIIDTFNRDAEKFGIPQRMSLNESVEDLYAENMTNENEKEINENDISNT